LRTTSTRTLALAATLLASAHASAHRREDYLQAARIGLEPDGVQITLDLTPGIAVAEDLIAVLDGDRDGALSANERDVFAARVVSALRVEIDGQPLALRVVSSSAPELATFRRGEGAVRLTLRASLPRLEGGAHRLLFRNAHLAGHSAYLANALVPESADVTVVAQHRTVDQGALTIEYTIAGTHH
jgi:hypothetical protein